MTGGGVILRCQMSWAQSEIGVVTGTYHNSWGCLIERRGISILTRYGNDEELGSIHGRANNAACHLKAKDILPNTIPNQRHWIFAFIEIM